MSEFLASFIFFNPKTSYLIISITHSGERMARFGRHISCFVNPTSIPEVTGLERTSGTDVAAINLSVKSLALIFFK